MPCTKPSVASVRVPARMMPTRQTLACCCALAADAASIDVAVAAQPRCVRNSRRCIGGSSGLVRIERLLGDEFGFAPPLNQSPFIPAKAGIQGPRTRPKLGPRFRGDERERRCK